MKLDLVPLTRDAANAFVRVHHRHCKRVASHRGAIGAELDGRLVGVAILANPSRELARDRFVVEIVRLCIAPDAPRNSASWLYARARRAAAGLGFRSVTTVNLDEESGASLRAAGFRFEREIRAFEIVEGDALAALRAMPDESANVVVTSPPYWRLRDYGVEGQLGLEETPELYVEALVRVFDEVRRVLHRRGSLWVVIGDSYAGRAGGNDGKHSGLNRWRGGGRTARKRAPGLRPKNLVGVPWRLALALQAAGWWLRAEIIWDKPTHSPECVDDRPTRAHETVFLLARSERYYYDAAAIAEPARSTRPAGNRERKRRDEHGGIAGAAKRDKRQGFGVPWDDVGGTRNSRSIWRIPSEPIRDEFYAAFPKELARRCIAAGSKPGDVVLDPFAGSGTTGVVALRLDRSFVGIELNPTTVALATRRILEDAPLFNLERKGLR